MEKRYLGKPYFSESWKARYYAAMYRAFGVTARDTDYRATCFKCKGSFVMFDGIMLRGIEARPRNLICDGCLQQQQGEQGG